MAPGSSPEERFARSLLRHLDQEDANELACEIDARGKVPSDEQLFRAWIDEHLLDREHLRDDEDADRWLVAFAWSRLDRDKLRAELVERARKLLPGARRAYARMLERAGYEVEPPKPRASGLERHIVLVKLAQLEQQTPGGLHSFRRLRPMTHLGREAFDRAVLSLAKDRRIVIHHHDYPAGLADAERAELVRDDRGTYYVGAGLPPKG